MPGGLHPPIEVMLSWPRPNFIDPETKPNSLLFIACVLGPLTIILLFVRLWVRIFHQRNPGWDDWLMLVATLPTIAVTILFPLAGMSGLGQHVWDFDPFKDSDKLVNSRKYILAIECIFCVASGLIKVSILLFYRRLSSRAVSNAFRWTTWITIGFIVAYTIALTLAPILGCKPVSAFWDQVNIKLRLQGYDFHCFDEGADLLVASIISAAQDLLTAVLPTFLYWNLQISKRQKVALFGIFAIGYGVVALGVLRAYYSWRTFYATYDITWSTHDIFIVSMLELHVGAFCANAPTLKVFFKHFFQDKLTSFSRSKSSSNKHTDSANSHAKSSSSGTSVLHKIGSIFGSQRRNNGYIAEPHASVSVDSHGCVQVQKEIDVIRFPSAAVKPTNKHASVNTLNILNAHYYHDVEMGDYKPEVSSPQISVRSTRTFEGSDFSALPPMPRSPTSVKSLRSPTMFQAIPSPVQERPHTAAPVVASEASNDARAPTPMPMPTVVRTMSQSRPAWQSWT
ncbi:hypothetical protein DE146DRAFT_265919 [Phaeosphaeria sp. MPI-PUGE-AT-0046c]|nr:hypothetical protein DE146DRAFT_265919 [Phaeosphaeria sp. MPI-PUGE-AT-0046c]